MAKKTIDAAWLDDHDWGIRSETRHHASYEGFRWKRLGAWTRCDDWCADDKCGGGLHYEAPESHGAGMCYEVPVLVETRGPRIRVTQAGGGKLKSPEARVVARGADIPREAFERCGYLYIGPGERGTVKDGQRAIAWDGTIEQHGGECRAYNSSRVQQHGGVCRAYNSSRVQQHGGGCHAYDSSHIQQHGGVCCTWGSRVIDMTKEGKPCDD